ncbi:hypothetical protein PP356_gp45 [Arthrobacter phage MargaretKali]|uniref:Uncharacterized protein n=1 Tax=Arthrobacter phage MargaretKali TaxID=2250414 RepID=A0A345KN23_9CAUD|nr:hypothetical protein PP356_gp45 [Arthrobacter phage MargaretKali]AXH44425.1 hypothetical protein SEA_MARGARETKALI_45 [Arthrobacter phage MargaretKali]
MPDTLPGMGGSFWERRTNREPGCTCPPSRYSPTQQRPTNPDCPQHGDNPCAHSKTT